MIKRILFSVLALCYAVISTAQITNNQTIGAPNTQVTNRGFFDSDSALHVTPDTLRSARKGSIAVIGSVLWIQAPMNVTDSSWQPITAAIPVTVGPIDSPTSSVNGIVVINNRLYMQHVTPLQVGVLDPTHFIHFQDAYALMKNSSLGTGGFNSVYLYPDTPNISTLAGANNFAVLASSLTSCTSCGGCISLGRFSQNSNQTGLDNISIGDLTLELATLGGNIAIGGSALRNANGSNATNLDAVGLDALSSCLDCSFSDAWATLAAAQLIHGTGNHVAGIQGLQFATVANHCTIDGNLGANGENIVSDLTVDGFGACSGCNKCSQCTVTGSLAADFAHNDSLINLYGFEDLQDDETAFRVAIFGHRDMTRAGSDTTCLIFGDDNISGASPLPADSFDRPNKYLFIFGDSNYNNPLGTRATSTQLTNVWIFGNNNANNSDTARSDIKEFASNNIITRNHFANFGENTQVIQLGNEGMTTATQNLISLRNTDVDYNRDSANYQQFDSAANYWYKWRKVITGSFSQSVTAVTTFTVNLPVSITSSAYTVTITPTAALSATAFYVSSKSPTSFNVTFISALTGTVMFDWGLTIN